MTVGKLFLLFIIYSFIGWIIEVLCKFVESKKFINRGFLIGPYLPIYGCAGVIITFTLKRYYNNPITLFVMSMFISAVLEYITSFLLEKLFNARWWDYTRYKFNINGRICLETMFIFGVLGCFIIYFLYPFFESLLSMISDNIANVISIIIGIPFIFDILVSFKIMSNFKVTAITFKNKDNTEELTNKVKEFLSNQSLLNKRLVNAFPNVRAVIDNIKSELYKAKLELKQAKKDLKKLRKK